MYEKDASHNMFVSQLCKKLLILCNLYKFFLSLSPFRKQVLKAVFSHKRILQFVLTLKRLG
jgi:hypothetical protein